MDFSGKKILLAEDDTFIADIIKKYLTDAKIDYLHVQNGSDGLSALEKDGFDLILSDLDMPIMSGCEMVEQIKQRPQLSDIPILILTNQSNEDESVQKVAALGVTEFFAKSTTPLHLLISRIDVLLHPEKINSINNCADNEEKDLSEMSKIPNFEDFVEEKKGFLSKIKSIFKS